MIAGMDDTIIHLEHYRKGKQIEGRERLDHVMHAVLDEMIGAIADEHCLTREEAHLAACRQLMLAMLMGATDTTRPDLISDLRALANSLARCR